jgi:hypothetical protein
MSKTISLAELAFVNGGIRLDPTQVDGVEDRRGDRPGTHHAGTTAPPIVQGPRRPNDLQHQTGFDDIGRPRR